MAVSTSKIGGQRSSGEEEDIEILLMGITGSGKSATGNSILGRMQFVSRGGWSSVTKDFHVGYTTINGRVIKVVDIPGFQDTDESSMEAKRDLVVDALTRAITKFPRGFHAVLLVIPYNTRLTEEEKQAIRHLIRMFDEDAFYTHGIVVMTCGDSFDRDYRNNMNVEDWMREQKREDTWIFETCGGRVLIFNNVTENEEKKRKQVNKLVSIIDGLKNKNKRYIPFIANCSESEKEAFLSENTCVDLESISSSIGLLGDGLYKVFQSPANERYEKLEKLRKDASKTMGKVDIIKETDVASKIRQKLSSFVEGIETCSHVREGNEMDKIKMELQNSIISMQKDLEKQSKGTGFWGFIKKQVSSFFTKENLMKAGKFAIEMLLSFGMKKLKGSGGGKKVGKK